VLNIFGIVFGIMNRNNGTNVLFFLELILEFLINLICSFIIAIFFNDKSKRENLEKKLYFLTIVKESLSKMVQVITALYNKGYYISGKSERNKQRILEMDFENNIRPMLDVLDYSKREAPMRIPIYLDFRNIENADWLMFIVLSSVDCNQKIKNISGILERYVNPDFYKELTNFCAQLDQIKIHDLTDRKIISNVEYKRNPKTFNKQLKCLSILKKLLRSIEKNNEFLINENKDLNINC